MNRKLAQGIVRTLGVSGPAEERLGALTGFGKADWQGTLPWLDDSALGLYLLARVAGAGQAPILPVAIRARLERNLEANRQRLEAMKVEFSSLNRHLEASGVEYAVLKGFALVPEYCPDAALRSQYDYDYLVRPENLPAAQAALGTLGYSRKTQSPGREPEGVSLLAAQPLTLPERGTDYYSSALPRRVELHTRLWEYDADGVRVDVPKDVLDPGRVRLWEGLHFPVLADVDALWFQSLHAFHHVLDYWCRLAGFLEIAHFLVHRQTDRRFWQHFQARVAGNKHLSEVVGLVFAMTAALFEAPIPREVSDWTASVPALSLWVQHYATDWALTPFPGSKLSLFVHREFVADARVWRTVRWHRLFPLHRPAQVAESPDLVAAESANPATSGPPRNGVPLPTRKWTARLNQWRYLAGRVKFHFGALLSYGWHLPGWKRLSRGASKSVVAGDGSRP